MRLLVVNPNSTASMTRKIADTARRTCSAGTEIIAVNPDASPASIEGYFDEALSVPGTIELVRAHPDADAVVIACFDDTGLDALRCIAASPVVGIGEAAFHVASMIACKFSVVTTLARSVPAIEHNLVRYGLMSRCAGVRASDIPVLDLELDSGDARERIGRHIARAVEDDKAEAIVLGCAGMTDLASALEKTHGVPILDGVACAVALCESLVRLGCKTSKIGGYAWPRVKPAAGPAAAAGGGPV